jgi:hypothetical protein
LASKPPLVNGYQPIFHRKGVKSPDNQKKHYPDGHSNSCNSYANNHGSQKKGVESGDIIEQFDYI